MIRKILFSFIALVCGCVSTMADTDLSTLSNTLYFKPITITAGEKASLVINMKNSEEVQAIGGYLYLPEGMTVAKNEYDLYGMLSSERTNAMLHTFGMNHLGNNKYAYALFSPLGKTFSGNDGAVFSMDIAVDKDLKPGDYTLFLREIELSNRNGIIGKRSVFEGTVTVVAPTGVTNVSADDSEGAEEIYTVGGVKIEKAQNGFNLIKKKDGKVIKIAK